jgi:hypothetical protein
LSKRQFEPRSIFQARPVRPASLTPTIQGAYPLALYLLPYPVELALAVVQAEVLIEAPQHLRQMFLLLPSFPVSVMKDPLPCPGQELPTTLNAGDTNQSKSPRSVHPTDMLEAQKLEGFRSPQSVPQTGHACESPKEYAPSFLLGQLQSEFREPLPHFLLELGRILSELETHHEVISETQQIRLASTFRSDLLLKPKIENKVKVKVTQHG